MPMTAKPLESPANANIGMAGEFFHKDSPEGQRILKQRAENKKLIDAAMERLFGAAKRPPLRIVE